LLGSGSEGGRKRKKKKKPVNTKAQSWSCRRFLKLCIFVGSCAWAWKLEKRKRGGGARWKKRGKGKKELDKTFLKKISHLSRSHGPKKGEKKKKGLLAGKRNGWP